MKEPELREIKLNHYFFQNSEHFINTVRKDLKRNNIECELLSDYNLYLLAWTLSRRDWFRRAGVDVQADKLAWNIKKNNLTYKYVAKYERVMPELQWMYETRAAISKCKRLREEFPHNYEVNKFFRLLDNQMFSDEYLHLLDDMHKTPGIYFLYDINKELIYIGKSYNISSRLVSSVKEKNAFFVQILETKTEADANILELYYIAIERPRLNSDSVPIDTPTFKIKTKYEKTDMIPIFKDE